LNALIVLAEHYRQQNLSDAVVVSPDLGNAKAASYFARMLGTPVAAGQKKRTGDDDVVIDTIVGEVGGRRAIVMDDEIANGGSMLKLLELLRRQGCTRFSLACTHGLFTRNAVQRLASQEDVTEIVSTNTVPIVPEKYHEKLKVLSIAPLFAEAIKRIHLGESISSLFH
jgi:ribose-phosphate pyrophosphokinase